jgi:hypothetical protein
VFNVGLTEAILLVVVLRLAWLALRLAWLPIRAAVRHLRAS